LFINFSVHVIDGTFKWALFNPQNLISMSEISKVNWLSFTTLTIVPRYIVSHFQSFVSLLHLFLYRRSTKFKSQEGIHGYRESLLFESCPTLQTCFASGKFKKSEGDFLFCYPLPLSRRESKLQSLFLKPYLCLSSWKKRITQIWDLGHDPDRSRTKATHVFSRTKSRNAILVTMSYSSSF